MNTDKSLSHVKKIVKAITTDVSQTNEAFNKFEQMSIYIKKKDSDFTLCEKSDENNIKQKQRTYKADNEDLRNILFKKQRYQNQLQKFNYQIEDLLSKSKILEWAGIKFNQIEWIKLRESMKKLTNDKIKDIKFWGKIYGTCKDYYIIQVKYKGFGNDKFSSSKVHEPRYLEGANCSIFFVSNNSFEDWVELPDVTYEQLRICRLFKYYFKGNLNSEVNSFIPFPGKESHLLKCTILRIMHSTFIVPEGYLEVKNIENSSDLYGIELNDKLTQVKEDFQTGTYEEYLTLEKWVHEYAYMYNNGRIINITEENPIPRLQTIAQDKPISETIALWNVKEIGDKMIYTDDKGTTNVYSSIVITNQTWIGSFTIFRKGEFYSIYIGDGIRNNGFKFYPLNPDMIQDDPEGLNEYKEPNPDIEPEIIETDSEKENEENKEDMDINN